MPDFVCINGEVVPAEEARVSVFDSGFMQGIGLFETMRAYDGRLFRAEQHLQRLMNSAATLGWSVVPDADTLRDNVARVVAVAPRVDLRVRLTVTTGSLRSVEAETPALTIVATATPGMKYPDDLYRGGVTLAVSPFRQSTTDPTIPHKTTSYFARLAGLREAHAIGAFETLWLTEDDEVAEGSISSMLAVRGGALWMPPLDTPVLPGITRATVVELAAQRGIAVQESLLTLEELRQSDEIFLANSMMEIMPVVRLDREPIGNEKPGEITSQLAIAYGELVDQECGDDAEE
ncbi:MAG: aminotransferase class IV [Phycisphaerae bacterium]